MATKMRRVRLVITMDCDVADADWNDDDLIANVPDFLDTRLSPPAEPGDNAYSLSNPTVWTEDAFIEDVADRLADPLCEKLNKLFHAARTPQKAK